MARELSVQAEDTYLHAVDTAGGEPPLLFVNGGFATLQSWRSVIQHLDGKYRAVQFDARARGKSGTSADYSVASAVDDVGRVIEATGLEHPVLVGWSHGATTAVRFAAKHPEQVGGLVLVDGAFPMCAFDEAGKEKVRAQFGRLGWMMRIAAAFRLSARMSPEESAEAVIGMDAVNGELEVDFAALRCPTVFVIGSGAHSDATEEEMRKLRDAASIAEAGNARVSTFATVPSNHVQILSNSPETIVAAIEHVIGLAR